MENILIRFIGFLIALIGATAALIGAIVVFSQVKMV
jgi:hypothetical protein